MEQHFIEYLLDALEERDKQQVEDYLAEHPEAQEKLALLKQALAPLAADKDDAPAPSLLVERTLARVAEHICSPDRHEGLPQAPELSPASLPAPRSWWRRVDVLVAACMLVTVIGVSAIVLVRMRGPTSAALMAECKNNLREFHAALKSYHNQHRTFPDIAKEESRGVAGMFVPILDDAGTLPASASIRCPGIGAPLPCRLKLASLREMSADDFERASPCLSLCYAYSLGYRDEAGIYHPCDSPQASWSQTPIVADRPPLEGLPGNSMNHGGAGQNVLFADGHVQFLTTRLFGAEDDIFLNRDGKLAAGRDAGDIVLGQSSARP